MKNHYLYTALLLCVTLAAGGCKKFLDAKPDAHLVVPGTLPQLQALLDTYTSVNGATPNAAEICAGDFYLSDADYAGLPYEEDRREYLWEKDHVFIAGYNDWYYNYVPVYRANTVLEQLTAIGRTPQNSSDWDNVKGQALLTRGRYFFEAAQIWAPAYDAASSAQEPGIPLRMSSDLNAPSVRATVAATYQQILADLRQAAALLPVTPRHVLRASRPAAFALTARVCLAMRDYERAGLYADSCLQLRSQLIDYNTLDSKAAYPFAQFNAEVIMETTQNGAQITTDNSIAKTAPGLYALYSPNDLRKTLFFKSNADGSQGFYGSYAGFSTFFTGLATDEVYLIRAEARVRTGKIAEARQDLNALLAKRWKTGTYVPVAESDGNALLQLILTERRKELTMRGIRWMDIKRLNREGAGISLSRTINGKTYQLPANDKGFALPIPEDVIALTGMPQNP